MSEIEKQEGRGPREIEHVEAETKVELEVTPPAGLKATGSFRFDPDATLENAAKLLKVLKKEGGE